MRRSSSIGSYTASRHDWKGAMTQFAPLYPERFTISPEIQNRPTQRVSDTSTREPESKKPSQEDWAKCLIFLVGRDRFELSTDGLRVVSQNAETAFVQCRPVALTLSHSRKTVAPVAHTLAPYVYKTNVDRCNKCERAPCWSRT